MGMTCLKSFLFFSIGIYFYKYYLRIFPFCNKIQLVPDAVDRKINCKYGGSNERINSRRIKYI